MAKEKKAVFQRDKRRQPQRRCLRALLDRSLASASGEEAATQHGFREDVVDVLVVAALKIADLEYAVNFDPDDKDRMADRELAIAREAVHVAAAVCMSDGDTRTLMFDFDDAFDDACDEIRERLEAP